MCMFGVIKDDEDCGLANRRMNQKQSAIQLTYSLKESNKSL